MKLCHLLENGWNWRSIMLSEISQPHKDKYPVFSLICGSSEGKKNTQKPKEQKIMKVKGGLAWK
jgi:hypothetical protein